MHRFKDEVRFYKRLKNDKVYTLGQDLEIRDVFVFDFGKYKFPVSVYEDAEKRHLWDKYIWVEKIQESTNHLFINFNLGNYCPEPFEYTFTSSRGEEKNSMNKSVYGIYDKNEAKLTLMRQPIKTKLGFKNDMDEGPVIWPLYVSSKNELVTYISAEDFLKHVAKLKNPSPKLADLAKRILPNANPVVIIAKLK